MNKNNAGRKKGTNEKFTVRCHPKAISVVREFAKSESKKHVESQNQSTKIIMEEYITTGWYVHLNNQYPKWKVFLDLENKTYHGTGVYGGKMTNVFDYTYMYDYILGNCIKTE